MPDIHYIPISQLDESGLHSPRSLHSLRSLMQQEQESWMADLGWDYSVIQQILLSFIDKRMLPGYAAFDADRMVGYIYFLISQSKGNIGALYTTAGYPAQKAQSVADGLVDLAVASFKDAAAVRRIEAQILPFHGQDYAAVFARNGFRHYPRFYLTMRLDSPPGDAAPDGKSAASAQGVPQIIPFDVSRLYEAAEMTVASYEGELDAEICEDYRTAEACENYLHSLVGNPGCGVFLPEASFMALDEDEKEGEGEPCGYVICSRLSPEVALIPQIAVRPDRKGRGLGDALMSRCLRQLRALNFHSLSLTVSEDNSRACDWYRRLGFQTRKEFGAFVWNRP